MHSISCIFQQFFGLLESIFTVNDLILQFTWKIISSRDAVFKRSSNNSFTRR